jgi:hypothetical protein
MSLIEPMIALALNAFALALAAFLTGFATAHPVLSILGIVALAPILSLVEFAILEALIDFANRRRIERAK